MAIDGASGIPLIRPHTPEYGLPDVAPSTESVDGSFKAALDSAIGGTNADIKSAQAAGEAFASGARDDIHGTMLALSQADIELKFTNNIRNKVTDAFFELWRMQI
ncbi:MAG TPA: flagellar hook-basal body complex protein FliE [Polyangiaceae bacterium]|jgi:flagellar hook-basal body complex protein FliE|nr:flagellar hook-basal body complex protein FliE [Polyangiaceae bacterium]